MDKTRTQMDELRRFLKSKEFASLDTMSQSEKLNYILSSKEIMGNIASGLLRTEPGSGSSQQTVQKDTLSPTNETLLANLTPSEQQDVQKRLALYDRTLKETLEAIRSGYFKDEQLLRDQDLRSQIMENRGKGRDVLNTCLEMYRNALEEGDTGKVVSGQVAAGQAGGETDGQTAALKMPLPPPPPPPSSALSAASAAAMSDDLARSTDQYIEQMVKFLNQNKKFDNFLEEVSKLEEMEHRAQTQTQTRTQTRLQAGTSQEADELDADDLDEDDDEQRLADIEIQLQQQRKKKLQNGNSDDATIEIMRGDDDELDEDMHAPASCELTFEYDKNGQLLNTGTGAEGVLKRRINSHIIKALESFKLDDSLEEEIANAVSRSLENSKSFYRKVQQASNKSPVVSSELPGADALAQARKAYDLFNDTELDGIQDNLHPEARFQTVMQAQAQAKAQHARAVAHAQALAQQAAGASQSQQPQTIAAQQQRQLLEQQLMQHQEKLQLQQQQQQYQQQQLQQAQGDATQQTTGGKKKKKKKKKSKNGGAVATNGNVNGVDHRRRGDPTSDWMCEFCEYEKVFGEKPVSLMAWFDKKMEDQDRREAYQRQRLRRGRNGGGRAPKRSMSQSQPSSQMASPPPPPTLPPPPPAPAAPKFSLVPGGIEEELKKPYTPEDDK